MTKHDLNPFVKISVVDPDPDPDPVGSGTGSGRIRNFFSDPDPELFVSDPDPTKLTKL